MGSRSPLVVVLLFASLLLASCGTLTFDLATVPIPISAKAATPADGEIEPFRLEAKSVLWAHGLFGHTHPDVAALVADASDGYDRIAGFRVRQSGSFHDWLLTHASATLVRMKTVVIEGQLVRDRPTPR